CSDGLHGPVTDEEILEILRDNKVLKQAGDALIARALEREGPDNVTLVLARFEGEGLPPPVEADVVAFVPYDPGPDKPSDRAPTADAVGAHPRPRGADPRAQGAARGGGAGRRARGRRAVRAPAGRPAAVAQLARDVRLPRARRRGGGRDLRQVRARRGSPGH